MSIRTSLVGLVIAASAVGLTACGSDDGISKDEADKLQKQSQELQRKAEKTAEDIRSGKVDAEQATKDLQKEADELTDKALDAAKDADIPEEARKQLEEAQKRLEEAANGR
jgi:hypothetical protein